MGTPRIPDNSRRSRGIGIRLTPDEKEMVSYISNKHEMDVSGTIRKLIRDEYYKLSEKKK